MMVAANDPAWQQWDAALTRVKSAADALKALSGQSQTSEKQRDDAEDELEDAMEALEKAAEKITSDDDDD
jgi:hypothetical protein